MTLELRCGDVIDGCDGVIRGESQEEVLLQAGAHAADAHDITEIDDQTERALVGAIHEV